MPGSIGGLAGRAGASWWGKPSLPWRSQKANRPDTVSHLASVRHTTVSMTNPADRVEIITSVQRRRRWTASEKVRIVEETFEPGMTVSLVARRHGVAPKQLWWLTADGSGEEVVPASDYRALQSQVRELQRLLDGCEAAKKEKRSRTVRSRRPKKKSSRAIVPSSSAWMAPRAPVSHRWSRPNIRSWRRGGRSKKNESTIARSRAAQPFRRFENRPQAFDPSRGLERQV